jgi:N-acetyl-S-(2-succino)cysteine monooxygenase
MHRRGPDFWGPGMMILGLNAITLGGHLGGWRHPDAWPTTAMNLNALIETVKIAERGKLDLIFLADGNGVRQMDKPTLFAANSPSDRPAVFEPVTLYAALSQHTSHIGFVATATTTYEEPFTIARKFASLDHLSAGRSGWNLVTTSYAEDALNFSHEAHVARDTRYDRARESLDVVRSLWDSWAEDAFVQNKATGQFLDPSKVRLTNHKGAHFSVKGPLNVARSPQGQPVVFMAGQSEAGKELAAYGAEALFGSATGKEEAQAVYADIKGRMAKYGRGPDELRILPGMSVFAGRRSEEADELYQTLQSLISPALGVPYLSKIVGFDLTKFPLDGPMPEGHEDQIGGTAIGRSIRALAQREGLSIRQTYERVLPSMGGNMVKGDAQHITDVFEDWYTSKACDGFVLSMPVSPRCLRDFVDLVVPELQRRGLFRRDYTGTTLRDNMGLARPADPFAAAKEMAAE